MKILILTQYFPPEIGAPQNRLFELALRLQSKGAQISVLTAMPNYPQMEIYEGYQDLNFAQEDMQGMKIYRSSIFVSKSKSISKRLRNYFSFVWSSYYVGKEKLDSRYDILLCESPPLFLGISGYLLAKRTKAKFIFNVSDLWPESAEKLGVVSNKFFLKAATKLEEFLYRKADLITGQTQGIVDNISSRFPKKNVYWLPNGVDVDYYQREKYLSSNWRNDNGFHPDDVIFFYGGIIGLAQGLEVILKAASHLQDSKAKFVLMGSGPVKTELQQMTSQMNLKNVYFFDPCKKSEMPFVLSNVDVALIPLKKLDLFKGAIPSKVFESLAMQLPILLGVDGEAKQIVIDDAKAGVFFEPENDVDLVEKVNLLLSGQENLKTMGENGRKLALTKFNRDLIAQDFYQLLTDLILQK